MNSEQGTALLLLGAASICNILLLKNNKRRRQRKYSVRPMNRNRNVDGHFASLVQDMLAKEMDCEQYFKYTRMTPIMFNNLLELVGPKLLKEEAKRPLTPAHRLTMTLHFLSQGCSQQEIAWSYRIGKTTVHVILKETCTILWETLAPIVLPKPSVQDWEHIIEGYLNRWNMPNCFGSLDGKHINIQCPKRSGSQYFNYKKQFSIVLMATCDAFYRFTLIDIGDFGSRHDSSVFRDSGFGQALFSNTLNLPSAKRLPGTEEVMDCFLVADQAFPLHKNIMRPYPGERLGDKKNIFNYRISRARRTIENTFGILVQRWRLLRSPIIASVEMCEKFVCATVVLHNFIQKKEEDLPPEQRKYCPTGYADAIDSDGRIISGNWRDVGNVLQSVGRVGANNATNRVMLMRNILSDYFVSNIGQVPWQWDHIKKGSTPLI